MNRAAISVLALLVAQSAQGAQGGAAAGDTDAAMFKAWDKNGDGQLSPAEFRAGREEAKAVARAQAALARQFAAMDANHDRAIDAGEYGHLLLVKDAGKAAPPLARFDADGDGWLEFVEYVRLVETLAPRHAAREDQKK